MTEHNVQDLISVIMPIYNCEQTIRSSVESVLMQTYTNFELIIIDDASDDSTKGICSKLKAIDCRIKVITNNTNCGVLKSRSMAASKAQGEWIAFIDADDTWAPAKLEKQLRLRDSADCDLVYTSSAFSNEEGEKYKWIMHVPETVSYKKLLKQNIISNSSVLVRKEDYLRYAPPADSGRDMHEDFACWLSMLKNGLTARGIDEPLITYRISKGSKAGNKLKASTMNMNTYKYIGLGFFSRTFYQACYAINGLLKHRHFM